MNNAQFKKILGDKQDHWFSGNSRQGEYKACSPSWTRHYDIPFLLFNIILKPTYAGTLYSGIRNSRRKDICSEV
jgi:hypothetical protein